MKDLSDLEVGKAAEHLVCFDLILQGHLAMLSDQGVPFDLIALVSGKMLKVQVKATRCASFLPQRSGDYKNYIFNVRRCGKGGRMSYEKNDVDVFAFVCLSTKEIAYVASVDAGQTMVFRAESHRGTYHDEVMTDRVLKIKEMKNSGIKNMAIANELGLCKSYIGRVLSKRETNYIKGRYMTDCTFDIACRRIQEAYMQPDLLIDLPKLPQKQELDFETH